MKKALLLAAVFAAASVYAAKTPPKLVSAPSPGYPDEMANTGADGVAEVDVIVKADGTVGDAQLAMATERAFGKLAMAAVRQWKFEPAMEDGKAIDQKVAIPFRFSAPLDQKVNASARRKVFTEISEPVLTEKDFPTKKMKVARQARPLYPRNLVGTNASEKVKVDFVVGPDGRTFNPTAVDVKRKEFEYSAVEAVAMTSYEPPKKDGKPVYVAMSTVIDVSQAAANGGGGGGARRGGGGGGGGGGGFGGGGGGGGFGGGGGGGGFGGGGGGGGFGGGEP